MMHFNPMHSGPDPKKWWKSSKISFSYFLNQNKPKIGKTKGFLEKNMLLTLFNPFLALKHSFNFDYLGQNLFKVWKSLFLNPDSCNRRWDLFFAKCVCFSEYVGFAGLEDFYWRCKRASVQEKKLFFHLF